MRTPLFGKRVLVVEDEPIVAMDYVSLLANAGARIVGTCATVREALNFLEAPNDTRPIDAAVVDFVLADRNSEPLQTELKQRHIPFVLVSAYPRSLVRTEAAEYILQKPVPPGLLCEVLHDACRGQEAAISAANLGPRSSPTT
jgi:CheY-like chemotaxis protein